MSKKNKGDWALEWYHLFYQGTHPNRLLMAGTVLQRRAMMTGSDGPPPRKWKRRLWMQFFILHNKMERKWGSSKVTLMARKGKPTPHFPYTTYCIYLRIFRCWPSTQFKTGFSWQNPSNYFKLGLISNISVHHQPLTFWRNRWKKVSRRCRLLSLWEDNSLSRRLLHFRLWTAWSLKGAFHSDLKPILIWKKCSHTRISFHCAFYLTISFVPYLQDFKGVIPWQKTV